MTVRNLLWIRQSFVFCFYFYCFYLSCFFLSLCFCLARNALQMSNGCELRATSKILYYRWVYNIVSLLFLTLMIGNSSCVASTRYFLAMGAWEVRALLNNRLIDDLLYLLVCKTYLCKFSSWKLMNDWFSKFCIQLLNIHKFKEILLHYKSHPYLKLSIVSHAHL